MAAMRTIRQLEELRERIRQERRPGTPMVTVCGGTGCSAFGSRQVFEAFEEEIDRQGLRGKVELKRTGCHGFCERGPVVVLLPQDIFYQQVSKDDVAEIVSQTVVGKEIIDRLLYVDPGSGQRVVYDHDVPFYRKQQRIVFRHNGRIDPTRIEDYLEVDGYVALCKALGSMSPEEVIQEVETSGLRGRGGAGFPTGAKWKYVRQAAGRTKFVVCNADEGDPGAFMDRSVLEGNPHAVLEGMLIAAYAIGAREGYVYVRAEYPLAVRNLRLAIEQAAGLGLLGEDILGTGFAFAVHIKEGAGAFVCGEETALIASIEGRRGMPRPRPPFPAQSGLWGCPTNINNVETYANVPWIIAQGGAQYARIGTAGSKGTKIFSLAGKINNTGLVEVPMGVTLEEVIFGIGGGIPRGRRFKAVQLGGPSGGCVPARHLDLPIDYDSLKQVGAIMGSGGMIVMDDKTCMVDIARYFMDFVQSESCGKCVPCRIGTKRMLEVLTRITQGAGREGDIELLQELGEGIRDASLCGLGQTAPNPVLSTIRYFRDEYEAHIRQRRCPAATCEALVVSPCQHTCPIHENAHTYIGLVAEGRFAEAYRATRQRNPMPAICGRVCFHPCEERCRRGELDEPVAVCALKRFVADYAAREGIDMPEPVPKRYGEKVAVIGAGPAGLSAAYHLARLGYPVTVFEALPVAGGMLAVGIPEYRLPREVLRREVAGIQRVGVEIRCGTRVGVDVGFAELRREHAAVFISTGYHGGRRLGIPGEDLDGVLDGVTFLRAINLGREVSVGRRVVVVGGGNVAMDAARAAARLGARAVTVVYRRSREEMPAHAVELRAAEEEGVELRCLMAPARIVGNGRVSGIECTPMRLGERGEDGRRQPVPGEGPAVVVQADTVIVAIGQQADLAFLPPGQGVGITRGMLVADPVTCATGCEGVFAGGDVTGGELMVVTAIADGERAAWAIHRYLRRGEVTGDGAGGPLRLDGRPADTLESSQTAGEQPRVSMPALGADQRLASFGEVELGYTEEMAVAEARRCLQCQHRR
ncbi:MAG: NADH-quinone oxidoreductase subunit NuoF [Candidatus Latescibacterota bacterium]